jgi:hypothetical protein
MSFRESFNRAERKKRKKSTNIITTSRIEKRKGKKKVPEFRQTVVRVHEETDSIGSSIGLSTARLDALVGLFESGFTT